MTQCQKVIEYMREFGSITSIEAFRDLGITRLSARIMEIEHMGIMINRVSEFSTNRYGEKTRYTRYSITQ